MFNMILN